MRIQTSTVSEQKRLSLPRSRLVIIYWFCLDLASLPMVSLWHEMDLVRRHMLTKVLLLVSRFPLQNHRVTSSTDHRSISCRSCLFGSQRLEQRLFWRESSALLRMPRETKPQSKPWQIMSHRYLPRPSSPLL